MPSNPSFMQNHAVWAAFFAWVLAQSMKMLRQYIACRKIDFSVLVSTGGMPSAHSAMVCALATSIGLTAGFGQPLFAVTLAFALIVMFDAQSFRRAAGQQARLLNQIVEELFTEHHFSEQKLAELLGHTRVEVFAGMIVGIGVGLVFHRMVA